MKIALVSPYDYASPGGVTVHVSQLRRQLEQRGHKVTVLAPCSKASRPVEDPGFIPLGRPFPMPTGGSIARITLSLTLGPKVKDILQDGQFDIVHLHEPLVPFLPITVLRFSQSVNVGTFHAFHGSSPAYRYTRRVLRRWFRKLHGKIAVSELARDFVNRYFRGYYNLIPNGVDLSHFSPDAAPIPELRDGKRNILFVGRMEKRKGLKYLLGAYSRIKWDNPDTRLIVVSSQKLNPECERVIAERGIRDVYMMRNVPYQDIPRYYSSADVFCSPATGKESQGIVLLEAMAAQRPIVATSIPGYAAVISHGVQGLLVEPKNEEALADSLLLLLKDTQLRQEMGERGRQKAQDYSWERVAGRIEDYYLRLLSERRLLSGIGGQ